MQDMVSYLASCDKATLETCIGGHDAVDFQSQMGNAYKQCAAFLLDSFDTHAAKSPKKRLVSQSKEQEAKPEGEDKHDEKKRRHYGRSLVRPVSRW